MALLLLGYAIVNQFLPGVVLGLFWPRACAAAVFAGIAAGCATVAALVLTHNDPFFGWNAGFVALCVNLIVTAVVSVLRPPTEPA